MTRTTWPLLASLGEEERAELRATMRPREFARGDVVCHEGEPADSLHLVAAGRLAVQVSLDSGDVGTVNVLGPGDYFGELALIRPDGLRTATIAALSPARTMVVSASAFRRLRAGNPALERALTQMLADRVDRLSHAVLELMHVPLDRRLYRRLAELALQEPGGVVPLTQAQLAELTGGTRPSVNLALQRLVDEGVVALGRGRVEVRDLAALQRLGDL